MEENIKLKENLDRYQNAILNKALENTYTEPSLSRHLSNQSRVTEKTNNENINNSKVSQNQEPFKITIDTHYIHK